MMAVLKSCSKSFKSVITATEIQKINGRISEAGKEAIGKKKNIQSRRGLKLQNDEVAKAQKRKKGIPQVSTTKYRRSQRHVKKKETEL